MNSMSVIVVDNGSKYIAPLLELLGHENLNVIPYDELDYKKLAKGDLVILTGGHTEPILWHKKRYAKETALVKRHRGPIVGICLGFELIAHIYGSHLHLLNNRRKGEVRLTPSKFSSIDIPASIYVYENHNWSVPKLKRPLKAIAYSDDGIEIFKHSRKPIYGLQFHPEKSSHEAKQVFTAIIRDLVKK